MKGFTVNMNELTASAGLDAGIIGIIVTNKSGDFTLDFSGTDNEGKHYSWIYEKMKLGDSITVKYEDMDKSNISTPNRIREMGYSDDDLLDEYNRLKQELIKDGVIKLGLD